MASSSNQGSPFTHRLVLAHGQCVLARSLGVRNEGKEEDVQGCRRQPLSTPGLGFWGRLSEKARGGYFQVSGLSSAMGSGVRFVTCRGCV